MLLRMESRVIFMSVRGSSLIAGSRSIKIHCSSLLAWPRNQAIKSR
ncbi:hypothetical protein NE237_014297 [Protea cynaroides]|uniref:Uncharacterized protein n=1 Tax=Protea cynaroides TaxID=273540 RepID=A0A9Q0JSG4_9MAGN|nr:hypothetical protein NE237_014297 [Protea cynaroides]